MFGRRRSPCRECNLTYKWALAWTVRFRGINHSWLHLKHTGIYNTPGNFQIDLRSDADACSITSCYLTGNRGPWQLGTSVIRCQLKAID